MQDFLVSHCLFIVTLFLVPHTRKNYGELGHIFIVYSNTATDDMKNEGSG